MQMMDRAPLQEGYNKKKLWLFNISFSKTTTTMSTQFGILI